MDAGSSEPFSVQLKGAVRQISASSLFGECKRLWGCSGGLRAVGACLKVCVCRLCRRAVRLPLWSLEAQRDGRAAAAAGGQHAAGRDLHQHQVGVVQSEAGGFRSRCEANGSCSVPVLMF